MRRRLQLRGDIGSDGARRRPLRAVARCHADDQLHIALAKLVDQQFGCLRRLRRRVLEATGRQVLGDRDAEDATGHHHKDRDRNDAPRRGNCQQCDSLQHVASSPVGYLR
jgi:hypothetical protein